MRWKFRRLLPSPSGAETGVETTMTDLAKALEDAVAAATHLTPLDMAAVEAMRALARKIDAWDVIVGWAAEDVEDTKLRPRVPQNDNVSISAFLKYCDALGLTPVGRISLDPSKEPQGGKLAKLRAVQGGGKPAARRAAAR